MLTSDVELVFAPAAKCTVFAQKTLVDTNEGCTFNLEPMAVVQEYAQDVKLFYGNFSSAWEKLTEYGSSDYLVCTMSLTALFNQWGSSAVAAQSVEKCLGDLNSDESVDLLDVTILLDRISA